MPDTRGIRRWVRVTHPSGDETLVEAGPAVQVWTNLPIDAAPKFGIEQAAWQAASAFQKRVLLLMLGGMIGAPVVYAAPDGTRWIVADVDLTLELTAYLGRLLGRLAEVTAAEEARWSSLSDADLLRAVKDWLRGLRNVAGPEDVDLSGPNPWEALLQANGAPAVVKMAAAVPAAWTKV